MVPGPVAFVMVRLDLVVHQVLDLERVQIAADHHAQIVGDELHHVVITGDARILGEDGTGLRAFDIAFDGHQSLFAHLGQYLEEHSQQLHVVRLVELGALEHRRQRPQRRLDGLGPVTRYKAAYGQADDGQVLHGHPQGAQAPMYCISADGSRQDDYVADQQ